MSYISPYNLAGLDSHVSLFPCKDEIFLPKVGKKNKHLNTELQASTGVSLVQLAAGPPPPQKGHPEEPNGC